MKKISIKTAEDLLKIGKDPNYPLDGIYNLMKDIDLNNVNFEPIGSNELPFVGEFNGNGFTIYNMCIDRYKDSFVGMFACIDGMGVVRNLNLKNIKIQGKDMVGGICGINYGKIYDCNVEGFIVGKNYVGGIVGDNFDGLVTNCSFFGDIEAQVEVGGIAGTNSRSIRLCDAYCRINGMYCIGGIVGLNDGEIYCCDSTLTTKKCKDVIGGLVGKSISGSISCNKAFVKIEGNIHLGGLVGISANTTIYKCYSIGEIKGVLILGGLVSENCGIIKQCYSSVKINFDFNEHVGGLVGIGKEEDVSNSYWNIDVSGLKSSAGGTGLSDLEMKFKKSYKGWNFVNVWNINEGETYPSLVILNKEKGENNESNIRIEKMSV